MIQALHKIEINFVTGFWGNMYSLMITVSYRWVVQAMKLELKYCEDKDVSINSLSPSMIKKLLHNVIKRRSDEGQFYSPERFVTWHNWQAACKK